MTNINATFERKSPASFNDKAHVPLGWFVMSHHLIKDKGDRRKFHGKWFKISSKDGTIYRILRFSVNLKGKPELSTIVVDWAGWIDLQGRAEEESKTLTLTIKPANWFQRLSLPVRHADSAVRLSGWLAYLSILLGVLSVFLAFMPLISS